VLPDDSAGQSLETLARKLSRCKEGMARVFAVLVQIILSISRVAVHGGLSMIYLSPYSILIKGSGDTLIYPPILFSLESSDVLQKP
jgi:hypothetical protein